MVMDRAKSAVFMLRGNFGNGYTPVTPSHFFKDNWSKAAWAEGWAESMYLEGLTAGCSTNPLKFCPYDALTNDQATVFGLWDKLHATTCDGDCFCRHDEYRLLGDILG